MGRQGAQRVPQRGRVGWRPEGPRVYVASRGQQRGWRTAQEIGELEISDLNRQNGPLPTNDPRGKGPTAFDSLLVFLRPHRSSGACPGPACPLQPTDISALRLQAVTRCGAPAGTVLGGGRKANRRLVSCRVPTHSDGATPVASAAALSAERPFLASPVPFQPLGSVSFIHETFPKSLALCQAGDLSPSCPRADACVNSGLGPRHAGRWAGQEQGGLLGGGDAAP